MNEKVIKEDGVAIYENYDTKLKVFMFINNGGALLVKFNDSKSFYDYGWELETKNKNYKNYWYSSDWSFITKNKNMICEGFMFRTSKFKNNTFKHSILIILSFSGVNIIKILKNFLIYRPKNNTFKFIREVNIGENYISIVDKISNFKKSDKLKRVFNISKRHTASANNFSENDFIRLNNVSVIEEKQEFLHNSLIIETIYK